MPKGPLITEAVGILIASVHHDNPKWTAPGVQHRVRTLLGRYNQDLPPGWPGLNSVQKVLAVLRKNSRHKEEDPLNSVWSIGVSDQHGIPPYAIPFVLKVRESWEESQPEAQTGQPGPRPSVREARWIGRLCHVIPDDIEALGRFAAVYARVEAFSELLDHDSFDSTWLDYLLIGSDRPLPFDMRAAVEHVQSGIAGAEDMENDEAPGEEQSAVMEVSDED